jgi:hypothetical protein
MGDNGKSMKKARAEIERLYAVYGADPGRWPAEARALAADRGLLGDPWLAEARREAQALDAFLDSASWPETPAGAAGRAVATALSGSERHGEAAEQPRIVAFLAARSRWSLPPLGRLAGPLALAASLVLGFYVGAAGLADDLIPSPFLAENAAAADTDVVDDVVADLEEDLG